MTISSLLNAEVQAVIFVLIIMLLLILTGFVVFQFYVVKKKLHDNSLEIEEIKKKESLEALFSIEKIGDKLYLSFEGELIMEVKPKK